MKGIVNSLLVILTTSFCFISTTAKASPSLPARFSAEGYASTDYLVGQADLMLPLKGDAWHNFYIDPALAYGSDSQGYADLGLGYRWLRNSSAILGGYLFGGYSRIANNARIWVVNPGIEALGSRWDAHLNGYFVMGDRNKNVSNFLTFDEFSGHSEFFNLFDVTQHAGDGVDVKLGYQLFPRTPLKAYVGSYFFSPSTTNNVLGGAVGLEYWMDQNIKVFASYTYDNLRRSVGALGLGVEFGGMHVHRSDPNVEERITDPVERYLAELGRGSAIPSQNKTQLIGQIVPVSLSDIAFFSQTGTPNNGGMGLTMANCTFANPCGPTDLTNQGTASLETLLPNTMIFFEGGTYSALDVVGGTSPVTIRTGQSINSYPATPPSTFAGGFILEGNNSLNNIILAPTTSTATGAGVTASGSNVLINGSQIGSIATPFAVGLDLSGNTQANLNNSMVFASSHGVDASNSASLTTNASMINVNGGANSIGINSTSSGSLNLTNGSSVNVTGGDSTFGVNSNGGGDFVLSDASSINVTGDNNSFGLLTGGAGTVTFSGASSINLNTSGSNSVGYFDQGSGAVNFNGGSSININTSAPGSAGYIHQGTAPVNFSGGSSINVDATGQDMAAGFGDAAGASGDITFDGSFVNVTGANDVIGLTSEGTGNLNIINGSVFNVTGDDDSFGLEIIGNRNVNFLGSRLTFTGGNNSFGFSSQGNGNITIDTSTFNLTGGTDFLGCDTSGNGTFMVNGSTFNVTGGSNSFVCQIAGSGPVNFISGNVLTMNAAGQASVGGIHTLSASSSPLIFDGSQINVTGGANPRGVFGQGTGDVTVSGGSAINVTGGDTSIGYLDAAGSGFVDFNGANSITVNATGQNLAIGFASTVGSGSNITLDGTNITVFGGDNSRGASFAGSGLINLIGDSITLNAAGQTGAQGLLATTNSTGNMTINGTQIMVNGGGNAQGFNVSGSGTIGLIGSTITVNAAGQTVVYGLLTATGSTSNVTVDGTQINVTAGGNSNGINASGGGNVLINTSLVNINGTGSLIGINASNALVTGSDVNLIVATDNADQAIGLATSGTATITLNGVDIDVSGSPSSLISSAVGGPITLTGTNVCMLNGSPVAC
ncbi:histidine kinase [Rickettsiella endosymbiont of Rhagonycha lignosa]|uniref:beta strand repeat-containing protein n=1 Tax=Rickettsiella endosymbiont of Rhagonycha lignosa TaxID=3077937 RepID=UPI00313C9872